MVRRFSWQAAAACGIVLVVASMASAQRGRGFGGGDPVLGLLRSDEVLKELEVTQDQGAEIAKILEESRGERPQLNFRELSEDERRARFAELREQAQKRSAETMAKIEKALLPGQVKRLKQLSIQSRGLRALGDEEVAKALSLSEAQQRDIAAAFERSAAQMRELFQDGNREAAREKMAELRTQSEAAVLAVLTDAQRSQFDALKGEAFEFSRQGFGRQGGGARPRDGNRPRRDGARPNRQRSRPET